MLPFSRQYRLIRDRWDRTARWYLRHYNLPPEFYTLGHHCGHESASYATGPTGTRECLDCYNERRRREDVRLLALRQPAVREVRRVFRYHA